MPPIIIALESIPSEGDSNITNADVKIVSNKIDWNNAGFDLFWFKTPFAPHAFGHANI